MMRTTTLALALVTLPVAALAAGQQSAPPASSTLGSIRGTATDPAGAPASGLFVVVFPADEARRSSPDGAAMTKRAPVNAGRFEITDLPPGDYRAVFATEQMLEGFPSASAIARLIPAAVPPIPLRPGARTGIDATVTISATDVKASNVRMSSSFTEALRPGGLPPGRGGPPPAPTAPGAISGRVTDADGKPVAGIEVRTMRRIAINGSPQFVNIGQATMTDADGRYRLANKLPADYAVVASAYSIDTNQGLRLVRRAPPSVQSPDGKKLGYVSTFHGGATEPENALAVAVATDERTDINIRLAQRTVWDVTGKVAGNVAFTGPPIAVTFAPLDMFDQSGSLRTRRVNVDDSGAFTATDLPDGEYLVSISGYNGWDETRIRIAGRQPDPVALELRPPMTVSGHVEFRGATPPPAIPTATGPTRPQYTVELRPTQVGLGSSFSLISIRPDNTFSTRASGPGPLKLQGVAPAPWVPVSGIVNGIDTLDLPMPFGANVENALIIFADHQTSLLVKVTDDADQPVANVGVLVFSDDSRYWPVRSRRVQSGQTMPGGACALSEFPPGKYFVVATREIGQTTPITPALIEQLKSRALPFELAAGESRSIQVRVH